MGIARSSIFFISKAMRRIVQSMRNGGDRLRRPIAESADRCRPHAAKHSPYAKSRRARVNVIICSTCVANRRSVASNCAGAKPVAQTMSHSTARSDCMQT